MEISPDYKVYPTTLIDYRVRPRHYFIKQAKIEKEYPPGIAALVGKFTHKMCETFFPEVNLDLAKENTEAHFLNIVTTMREIHWNTKIPQERVPIVMAMLRNFAINQVHTYRMLSNKNLVDQFFPLSTEEEIVSKKYPIGVIIDRINKNSFNCIDYKTNFENPSKILRTPSPLLSPADLIKQNHIKDALLIQACLAAIVVEEKYGKLPERFTYVFLRDLNADGTTGTITVNITQEKCDMVLSWVYQMLEDVKADKFPKCTLIDPGACYKYNQPCEYISFCQSMDLCIFNV